MNLKTSIEKGEGNLDQFGENQITEIFIERERVDS